jgi:enediyne biosynthesis protein E4
MISRRTFLQAALAAVAAPTSPVVVVPRFELVPASRSGITWVHENAMSPQRFLPESLGPGVAFVDYDNDGWMDLFFVNSGTADFYQPARPLTNALYHNNRDGTFTDVTARAGVKGGETFSMGVAVGDYDNDGYPDLFVTAYGRTTLYHNKGDGTFTDVTARAGVAITGWTTSAAWFDYDNDGRLDLFVCSYVDYDLRQGLLCADRNKDGSLYYHYCIPHLFKPTPSVLFHNNGDGTFTRVRGTALDRALGKALGVVAVDVDRDGRIDLIVANDTAPNFLLRNRGGGQWLEDGERAGIALGASGRPRSGMGVDAADLTGDGFDDVVVANIDHETFSLYESHNGQFFTDAAADHGLTQATALMSGWGAKFFDADNDGRVDLLLANGHPDDVIAKRAPEVRYKEPLILFQHDGRRLRNVSVRAGDVFTGAYAARGLAVGDFDNDGRVDALVGCNGDAPLLLHNVTPAGHHWLGVRLQGTACNRDAIGARLTWSAGGVRRSRAKNGGGSYLSSHDPREVLGVGTATSIDWLDIVWPLPSGKTERFTRLPIDRYVTIVEGKGIQG